MPPRMARDATTKRTLRDSPRIMMPPNAAMTGTLSGTVAAVVAFSAGSTEYQVAYPNPEATAPETMEYKTPTISRLAHEWSITLSRIANNIARRKFPAVILVGFPAPFPRNE